MGRRQTYRARTTFYLFGGIVFLLAAVTVVLFALGYRLETAPLGLYKTGLIVLKSQPSNAFVTVDDRLRSEQTNARLALAPGEYTVKVDLPGTIPWQKRINLESGEAVLEENILLFRAQPETTTISDTPIGAVSLSADQQRVTYSVIQNGVGAVRSRDLSGQSETTIGPLPAGFAPGAIQVSSDGSRALLTDGATAVVTGSGLLAPVSIGGVSAARFIPNDRDQVFIQSGTTLVQTNLTDGGRTPAVAPVGAWTTTRAALYAASGRTVTRLEGGNHRTVLSDQSISELIPLSDADAVLARTVERTLFLITPDGTRQIAEQIDRFAAHRDGSVLALVSGGELSVWRRSDGDRRLVTRSTTPFDDLAIVTDGQYVLYIQSGQIHSIATDGSNDQVLQPADGPLLLGADTTLVRRLPTGAVAAKLLAR